MPKPRTAFVMLLTAAVVAPVCAATAQPASDPFSHCPTNGPASSYESLLCVYQTGLQRGLLPASRARLRQLGGGNPAVPWATLVLAHAQAALHEEAAALQLYEAAAARFADEREAEGEVIARQNLRILYQRRGAAAAAATQVDRAVSAAEASQQPLTIARAAVLQASHFVETGGDLGAARLALLRAQTLAFPGAPIGLRRTILFTLSNVQGLLGQLDEAVDTLERHRALRAEDGSLSDAAAVEFNLLTARVIQAEGRPTPGARQALVALATAVVDESARQSRPYVEAHAQRVLAELVKADDRSAAAAHLARCLQIESTFGHPAVRAACLWSQSLLEADRPSVAEALSQEAIALTSAHRTSALRASAWQSRLRLVWKTLPADRAIAESMQALDAIERLRAAQTSEAARAALFSNWTRDYYWLTGQLLSSDPPRIDLAFEVGERLRTRVLLEHLRRSGVRNDRHGIDPSLADVARRIADTQRRLLVPSLSVAERQSLLDQLQLLEIESAESGTTSAASPEDAPAAFATIPTLQQALGANEAALWYAIAPWTDLYGEFGGGAWVIAITRERASLHKLATRVELDTQVAALAGLLQSRTTTQAPWSAAARGLGDTLLADALDAVPPSVTRLTIVTDDRLHSLPFEALSTTRLARPIGERFDITTVPSATLLLRLRQVGRSPHAARAIVFADPELFGNTPLGDRPLAPLPFARREATSISHALGLPDAAVLAGLDASEPRLKTAAVTGFGLLHLAAHARADAAFPDRSAVFLSAGGAAEDGWLQPREIAALGLGGAGVVLSACESAVGPVVSGEGPLSLARAFFAGGATAVVATRWPLRDDDAAFVMERLYRGLASGAAIDTAVRRARLEALEAGLPTEAWAGIALIGDGSRVYFERVAARRPWIPLTVSAGLVLLALAGWMIRRARR